MDLGVGSRDFLFDFFMWLMFIDEVSDVLIGIDADSSICGCIEFHGLPFSLLAYADFDLLAGEGAVYLIKKGLFEELLGGEGIPVRVDDSVWSRQYIVGVINVLSTVLLHMLKYL